MLITVKKLLLFVCVFVVVFSSSGMRQVRTTENPIAIKAQLYSGYNLSYLIDARNKTPYPMLGGEVAVEFLPRGNYKWERDWRFPTIGIALSVMDFGNLNLYGQMFSVYPYALVPMVKSDVFKMNYKVGAGLGLFYKRFSTSDVTGGINSPDVNSAIGSVVNAHFNTALNFEFTLNRQLSLVSDIGLHVIGNGNTVMPNGGFIIPSGSLGVKYQPFSNRRTLTNFRRPPRIRTDFLIDLSAAGGVRQLYYKDHKSYAVASFQMAGLAKISRKYAVGGALDFFNDFAFVQQGARGSEHYHHNTLYERYFIPNDNYSNKLRIGLALTNQFTMGRVTVFGDVGLYLYDGLRNANPIPHKRYGYNRPMIYSYKLDEEDGWNYFKLGMKVRLMQDFYVKTSIKTHLTSCEFVDFGFGYTFNTAQDKNRLRQDALMF